MNRPGLLPFLVLVAAPAVLALAPIAVRYARAVAAEAAAEYEYRSRAGLYLVPLDEAAR